jgi:hypothetical protein
MKITPQLVAENASNYFGSRSNTILALISKGFEIDETLWENIKEMPEVFASDILCKIPNNFLAERVKLVEIIINKNPSKLPSLLEITKDNTVLQGKVFEFFEARRGINN